MAVSGRVTSGDQPVRGAAVTIRELEINVQTNDQGRYSFLVRAAQVRGQTVTIVARHSRFGSQSAQLVLAGNPVELDFTLRTFERPQTPEVTTTTLAEPSRHQIPSRVVDSTFAAAANPLDVISALAGRIPGLVVTGATAGGSARMEWRGPRSLAGATQPLVVVDGVPVRNGSTTSATQAFGLGGFDYGTPVQDIALDDIASITLLSGPSAVALHGSRAANGILSITTKQGSATRSPQLFGALRFSSETPARLPKFQNRYGQGSAGLFEFFDGQGGGISDDVEESWGPALDGQPIAQASLTEARRPDVRHWLPAASGVSSYFPSGRTIEASGGLDGARQWFSGRAAVHARLANGTTPGLQQQRLGAALNFAATPNPRFTGRGSLQLVRSSADGRHGTGFDESNPSSGFTRMGRQVDLDALRAAVDVGPEQINWIYTGRNNPWFQTERNTNDDARQHVLGSSSLRYVIGNGLSATLAAGLDHVTETRDVHVARGWKGSYPTALGRRDFSDGGTEQRDLTGGERILSLAIQSTPRRMFGWDAAGTVGVERRSNNHEAETTVVDTLTVTGTDTANTTATALYALGSASRSSLVVDAGARMEKASFYPGDFGFAIYPTLSATYDAARHAGALRTLRLAAARLRASWWRAGNELSPVDLRNAYAGGGTASDPALGVADSVAPPERTSAVELGAELTSGNRRAALDVNVYRERTSDVLVPTPGFVGQIATISNKGIEAQLRLVAFGDASGSGNAWLIAGSFARNTNTVDGLQGTPDAALSPSIWGASLAAREGQPAGVILGTRFLRDSVTRQLVLSNGLPVADAAGLSVLGSARPDWTAAIESRLRFGRAELGVLFDARIGGSVFSATNLWGSYSGTLAETLVGREAGMTIPGIDSVTGAANAAVVSAEDYFHALGGIDEAFVYDASYWKVREMRLTYEVPLRFLPGFREHMLRASLVGRNVLSGARAPNIDPETVLSPGSFVGFEMGQLPTTRSVGIRVSVTP